MNERKSIISNPGQTYYVFEKTEEKNIRTIGVSDKWCFGLKGFRTNGTSEYRAVPPKKLTTIFRFHTFPHQLNYLQKIKHPRFSIIPF